MVRNPVSWTPNQSNTKRKMVCGLTLQRPTSLKYYMFIFLTASDGGNIIILNCPFINSKTDHLQLCHRMIDRYYGDSEHIDQGRDSLTLGLFFSITNSSTSHVSRRGML